MGPLAYLSIGILGCLLVGHLTGGYHDSDCSLPDWISNQGHCYGFFAEKVTWHQARVRCRNFASHLAAIENDELFESVAIFLMRYGVYEDPWIDQALASDKLDYNRGMMDLCPSLDKASNFLQHRYTICEEKHPFLCEKSPKET